MTTEVEPSRTTGRTDEDRRDRGRRPHLRPQEDHERQGRDRGATNAIPKRIRARPAHGPVRVGHPSRVRRPSACPRVRLATELAGPPSFRSMFGTNNGIAARCSSTPARRSSVRRWLPGLASGTLVASLPPHPGRTPTPTPAACARAPSAPATTTSSTAPSATSPTPATSGLLMVSARTPTRSRTRSGRRHLGLRGLTDSEGVTLGPRTRRWATATPRRARSPSTKSASLRPPRRRGGRCGLRPDALTGEGSPPHRRPVRRLVQRLVHQSLTHATTATEAATSSPPSNWSRDARRLAHRDLRGPRDGPGGGTVLGRRERRGPRLVVQALLLRILGRVADRAVQIDGGLGTWARSRGRSTATRGLPPLRGHEPDRAVIIGPRWRAAGSAPPAGQDVGESDRPSTAPSAATPRPRRRRELLAARSRRTPRTGARGRADRRGSCAPRGWRHRLDVAV